MIAGVALLSGIGLLLLGLFRYESYWALAGVVAVIAVGIGLASAPATTAIMSNTPLDNQGVGSAVNDTAREIGAAIGIAIAGSIVAAGYQSRIGETAQLARDELAAAGQQRIAAGDTAGGQAMIAEADQAGTLIERSLAEASVVVDRLSGQAAALAEKIADGSQEAFYVPFETACLVLGGIMLASSVALLWLTPRRVVEVTAADEELRDPDSEPERDDTYARD